MKKHAVISDCGRYRYTLSRIWDDTLPVCTFIMLNPSTADADLDDPTIRRCISFAKREGCGAICVVNLFAFRATEPKDMKDTDDPIGLLNPETLAQTFEAVQRTKSPAIVAWGAHGTYKAAYIFVAELAKRYDVQLKCFGTTATGQPKHPLYIKNDEPLVPWPSLQLRAN